MDMNTNNESQELTKELNLLTINSTDYIKTIFYFEINDLIANVEKYDDGLIINNRLNENLIKEKSKLLDSIQNIFVLNGNRSVLINIKENIDLDGIETNIKKIFNNKLIRKPIPLLSNQNPIYLACEVSDTQLESIDSDKYNAIKKIEAKTGLKLKKIKKHIYFSGLLFQFIILNEILSGKKNELEKNEIFEQTETFYNHQEPLQTISLNNTNEILKERHSSKESIEWQTLYNNSEIKYNFKLKPKIFDSNFNAKAHNYMTHEDVSLNNNKNSFEYDVYIFQADLTDLNTDALVNASNPDLHPGYDGDGISRRIREKAGKQMRDACKAIIKHQRNNKLLNDGDVVFTKSFGKLKSKYVLHSVAPTWTKYILMSENSNDYERFESLAEQSFTNILKLAHDTQINIRSIAFPASENISGGAFDLPLELYAHLIYTQLLEYKFLEVEQNMLMKTICICSIELQTVKALCDIFSYYFESYSTTSWAMPSSPFGKLLQNFIENNPAKSKIPTDLQENSENVFNQSNSKENNYNEPLNNQTNNIKILRTHEKIPHQQIIQNSSLNEKSNIKNNNSNTGKEIITLENIGKIESFDNIIKNRNAVEPIKHDSKKAIRKDDYCCLFCQKDNENSLIFCGNSNCKGSYCEICIVKYMAKQNSKKCPSCHNEIENSILIQIRENRSSSSSSLSPTRINQISTKNNQQLMSYNHHGHNRNQISNFVSTSYFNQNAKHNQINKTTKNLNKITDGKIFIRELDEVCEGYENFKSLLVTFEIPNGIQNKNHPKPGLPYKGTIKRAYLPNIKERIEILAFYEKALKYGMLFKVEWNKNHNEYRVHLNQGVLLKTNLNGGGRFGYPDPCYIDELLKMAKNIKQSDD